MKKSGLLTLIVHNEAAQHFGGNFSDLLNIKIQRRFNEISERNYKITTALLFLLSFSFITNFCIQLVVVVK